MPPRKSTAEDDTLAYRQALGHTVRRLRKPLHNQDDFADLVGIYRSHMGLIEQGKLDLRLSTLLRVARALQLSPEALLAQVNVEEEARSAADFDRSMPS